MKLVVHYCPFIHSLQLLKAPIFLEDVLDQFETIIMFKILRENIADCPHFPVKFHLSALFPETLCR